MDRIQIVSWLLTRRCNLNCSYCAITRDYKNKPSSYPNMKHYHKNEMTTSDVIGILRKLKLHNPDMFHLLYGGEPLLRKDLAQIINFCNEESIHYTIISNNSDEIQPLLEDLFVEVDYINGFTASIDPVIVAKDREFDKDRVKKSVHGYIKMVAYNTLYKDLINDLVAEITVDNETVPYLYELVKMLTNVGINSDITFIDIAHSPYYDFSNVTDKNVLVEKTPELEEQFQKIFDEKLDVHMGKKLCDGILKILPSNMDCGIEKDVHNLTIDADGSCRLCLRIRGTMTPKLHAQNVILKDGRISPTLKNFISKDKAKYCRGCNWSCMCMSDMLSKQKSTVDQLVHTDRRV